MPAVLRSMILFGALLLAGPAPLAAQDKIPPAAGVDAPAASAPRDGTSAFVAYLVAALGAAAVLTAIALPIRRE